MSKLLIKDLEDLSATELTQISKNEQEMTVGGCCCCCPPPPPPPPPPCNPRLPQCDPAFVF